MHESLTGFALILSLLFLVAFCIYVYQLIVDTSVISKESADTLKEDKIIRRFVWHGYFMIALAVVYIFSAYFHVKMSDSY